MVHVGDLARYYYHRKRDENAVLHPVLYMWQESKLICINEADADLLCKDASVSEYDVSDVLFGYPVCMYGYPEIYKSPLMPTHVRSYLRRLFNPLDDVWIRYERTGPL